ncbi:hypothetical protein L6164_036563 [Bauhinia variegata]|uniref:Uncharacterized protein n=1 Tax=Bauhinia variegata TaxID=167791 RepID=A0ACB9KHJ1_BAUVA|nr:hypothetical protein L6164_036563 [Bauhinia variegata]
MEERRVFSELKFISALALIKFMNLLWVETFSFLSLLFSDPLFSCIVTICTLVFLYLPHLFRKIVFSPVLILTGILLLTILRLGAIQRSQNEEREIEISEPIVEEENRAGKEQKEENPSEPVKTDSLEQVYEWVSAHSGEEINSQVGFDSTSGFEESFVEWNVKAPLEVIYEEYNEGEETGENPNEKKDTQLLGIGRYRSLARYYPESDSDSSSDGGFPPIENWDSAENICFSWDEEDREELIEIALDDAKKRTLEFHFDEDNLIEIDISPTRYCDFPGENDHFPGEISCN